MQGKQENAGWFFSIFLGGRRLLLGCPEESWLLVIIMTDREQGKPARPSLVPKQQTEHRLNLPTLEFNKFPSHWVLDLKQTNKIPKKQETKPETKVSIDFLMNAQ